MEGGDNTRCLGIRRETVNVWERRAPLAPHHVSKLTENGVKVLIQPSNRRVFPISEYIKAGAVEMEELNEASLIIGVKQVPLDSLIPNKTYTFFSHTIKGQKENMKMLDDILQKNIRLIDYEKMVDENNRRLVAFGKYAGYAGMINILHGLGLRLLALGHNTPFLHIGQTHNYRDKHTAISALRDVGYDIALDLMPRSLGPLIFVFTGRGNVSQGAQELFRHLPHEYVTVNSLPEVAVSGKMDRLYVCVVGEEDHLYRKDTGKFDSITNYEKDPHQYQSTFSENVAPYANVIVNGIYWAVNAPRLVSRADAKMLLTPSQKTTPDKPGCPTLPHRLIAICDISADPEGSIEFMTECTTIDRPFCIYDPHQNINTYKVLSGHEDHLFPVAKHSNVGKCDGQFLRTEYIGFADPGILMCSVDNLPAQLAREATNFFGDVLLPYINDMLESDAGSPFDQYNVSPAVRNAVIASNGELTPNFKYITNLRKHHQ